MLCLRTRRIVPGAHEGPSKPALDVDALLKHHSASLCLVKSYRGIDMCMSLSHVLMRASSTAPRLLYAHRITLFLGLEEWRNRDV